jgi:hypothetical protein
MATTTNYGWTTPDDTALVKDGAAAIRTLGSSVDTTTKNLNPETTLGDIAYRSSTANVKTRLGIGTTGQVLSVSGGVPAWTTPASGATFSGVSLTKSVSQTLSNNTQTAITFDTESLDTNSYHSTSTNTSRITIPAGKAGKYLVFGHIAFNQNATSFRRITFYKNGSSFAGFYTGTTSGNFPTITAYTAIMDLAEGDYVEMFGLQNSGGDLTVRGDDETAGITAFAAFLIGA